MRGKRVHFKKKNENCKSRLCERWNLGAHHLPRIPHTSLLSIILYCHPVFSRRLFLFLIFLFILIALPVESFLYPPSAVQCNGTFQFPPYLSLFFLFLTVFHSSVICLSSCSLYSKKVLYREKNTELLFFLYLHVTKISVHRCRSSEETFLIGRFTAPGDCT